MLKTVSIAFVLAAAPSLAAAAPAPQAMIPHAFFHALEARAAVADDPHVFVHDASGHARPLRATDDPGAPLYNANGTALNVNAGAWLGARGTIIVDPAQAHPQVAAAFAGLIPGGTYSLFVATGTMPASYTPLDGTGSANTFTADPQGRATVTIVAPSPMTAQNAIVLVFHSDGTAHGADRGNPGVTAHEQLAYHIP